MTQGPGNYRFDFEEEVHAMRHHLSSRADNMLFVEVDVDQPVASPVRVSQQHIAADESIGRRREPREWIDRYYRDEPRRSSAFKRLGPADVFAIRKHERATEVLGEDNTPLMRLFVFYHEVSHALITTGPDEHSADAYAALRFLQRFGPEATDFLSQISWLRTRSAINNGSIKNLSTFVLDKIIADSATHDFSKLTAEETISLAKAYARDWAPTPPMLGALREAFGDGQSNPRTIAGASLASPDDFTFYIGAKFFQPFLRPEGMILNGQHVQMPAGMRKECAGAIAARAEATGLHVIFNRNVQHREPSMADALKVARPAGQKIFTVKTKFS